MMGRTARFCFRFGTPKLLILLMHIVISAEKFFHHSKSFCRAGYICLKSLRHCQYDWKSGISEQGDVVGRVFSLQHTLGMNGYFHAKRHEVRKWHFQETLWTWLPAAPIWGISIGKSRKPSLRFHTMTGTNPNIWRLVRFLSVTASEQARLTASKQWSPSQTMYATKSFSRLLSRGATRPQIWDSRRSNGAWLTRFQLTNTPIHRCFPLRINFSEQVLDEHNIGWTKLVLGAVHQLVDAQVSNGPHMSATVKRAEKVTVTLKETFTDSSLATRGRDSRRGVHAKKPRKKMLWWCVLGWRRERR